MTEGQGFSRRVTRDNLEQFASLLRREGEADPAESVSASESSNGTSPDPEIEEAKGLFAGESISLPSPAASSQPVQTPGKVPPASGSAKGALKWSKELSSTDAQKPPSPGSSPTGHIKLTQAGFREGSSGELIDHSKYFRINVFGNLNWSPLQSKPSQEEAFADFEVSILGSSLGTYKLRISHDPGRIAAQSNVPTWLHLEELNRVFQKHNLAGKTFELYAPPAGQKEPFFIEIS